MRQQQVDFVKAINEISRGELSEDTHNLIKTLGRKLPPWDDPIRLCARNFDCKLFNSCPLIDMDGDEFVFNSVDEGYTSKLERLHLKLGCPVMLLKNLSEHLVNGLREKVTAISTDTVTVNFTDSNF